MPRLTIDIPPGTKIGRLTVLSTYQPEYRKPFLCKVRCDCGTEKVVIKTNLLAGLVQSCGCLQRDRAKEVMTTHGHGGAGGKKSPTYVSWHAMWARIKNPVGKGRAVYANMYIDPRWEKFENFLADMGERPEGTTLDRYPDNEAGYFKENCRWATPFEQSYNRRSWVISPKGLEGLKRGAEKRRKSK